MSMSSLNCPNTPHPNIKVTPAEQQRQCWTLPPPDRSISAKALGDENPPAFINFGRRASTTGSTVQHRLLGSYLHPARRQSQEGQPPLAIRLMRDSERRELDRTDVFSPKNSTRRPLTDIANSPIRPSNSQNLLDGPSSPFVKCLLSNTPAKLPAKISVLSPGAYNYENPPKLRRLSIQGDSIEEFRLRQSGDGQSIEKQDPHAPVEKLTRPLPNVQGEIEFEVISSPVSPLRDRDLMLIPEEAEEESMGPLSSPIRHVEVEDPFTSNKRQKLAN
ncbi:hypothetical protein K493DRAFT_310981 [Basidiobolus meristosporus CBS 931.73]|uniref:Uncharacterized protein n=1 Tax=Basidiobolus meristosporus CBS 931.73 TaxID=1314790 RepID=A0A1Y1Z5B6_9FUNG|nr:hypothetical protein K493DRAFT_310981 [Basidiobolus meristosporus CBS 931.73]|eukprot:ORY05453.1 hypothetical protein K493DRAFT_310981 [Basidiobolus meristosporus CBS 931.73]